MTGLPLAAVWAAAPVLVVQGRRVRRTTPRLPEAAGPTSGSVGAHDSPLSLLVLGDSVAAGVGLAGHHESLAGRVAARLHLAMGRPVAWRVHARSGATAVDVRDLLAEDASGADGVAGEAPDVVVVSVGVNDCKALHGDRRWERDLAGLLDELVARWPGAQVVLLGLPPMAAFPALPPLLGRLLGGRARRLDALGGRLAGERGVRHLSLELPDDAGFAPDGFHPGAVAHDRMAEAVVAVLVDTCVDDPPV